MIDLHVGRPVHSRAEDALCRNLAQCSASNAGLFPVERIMIRRHHLRAVVPTRYWGRCNLFVAATWQALSSVMVGSFQHVKPCPTRIARTSPWTIRQEVVTASSVWLMVYFDHCPSSSLSELL